MGLTYVTVGVKGFGAANEKYEASFLVDTGATDSFAPADELQKAGIKPVGKMIYELADGTLQEYEFGLAEITFQGELDLAQLMGR